VEDHNIQTETLSETENYAIWVSEDEGEVMFHLEVGMTTINFLEEDWDEFLQLIAKLPTEDDKAKGGKKPHRGK
jgi:hypothetical protein